jgi:hypothetical protein
VAVGDLVKKLFLAAKVDEVDPQISTQDAIRIIRFRMSEILRKESPEVATVLEASEVPKDWLSKEEGELVAAAIPLQVLPPSGTRVSGDVIRCGNRCWGAEYEKWFVCLQPKEHDGPCTWNIEYPAVQHVVAGGWLPIEQPPDYVDDVLVALSDGDIVIGYWREDAKGFDSYDGWLNNATHWMPLPAPPAALEAIEVKGEK